MLFLKIYIIGFLVSFFLTLLIEHFYYGNGRAETVGFKSIIEDFLYSLSSWLGVVGLILYLIGEWYTGFDSRGYGEFLYDLEQELKKESENKDGRKDENYEERNYSHAKKIDHP